VIHETEMRAGERYEVPANIAHPAIRIGRAEALDVTIGGRRIPPLCPPSTTLSDVSLRAADLVNRSAPATEADGARDEEEPRPSANRP